MSMLFVPETESAALVTHALAYAAAREALLAACGRDATSFPVVLAHGSDRANRFSVKASSHDRCRRPQGWVLLAGQPSTRPTSP